MIQDSPLITQWASRLVFCWTLLGKILPLQLKTHPVLQTNPYGLASTCFSLKKALQL